MRGVKTSIANSFIVAPLLLLSCFVSFVVERVEATATEAATPQPEHEASCPNQDTGDDDAAAEEFLALWEKSDRSHPVYESLVDLSAISAALHCDDDTGEDPRFPTDANYALMIEAYVHASKLNPNPRGRPPTATEYNPEAFFVPVEVRASSEMGRGVFSLGDVAKGTMVNRPSNAMEFYNRETLRDYIAYLLRKRSPQLICDTFEWFYATKASSEPNDYIICLDADDASMINSAHDSLWDDSQDDDDDDGFSGKSTSDGRIMVEEDGVLYEGVIDSDGRIMVEQDGVLYEFQVDGDDEQGHSLIIRQHSYG